MVTRKVEVEVEMYAIDGAVQRSVQAVVEAVERIRGAQRGGWKRALHARPVRPCEEETVAHHKVTRKVEVEVEMHAIDGAVQRSVQAVEEAVETIRGAQRGE